jgi:hypothetical protein
MALEDAIKEHTNNKNDSVCAVGILIESLSETDKVTLVNAINNGVPTHSLVLALRQEGYRSSDNSFNTHRQGKCKCAKTN